MTANELKALLQKNALTLAKSMRFALPSCEIGELYFDQLEDALFRPDVPRLLADQRFSTLLEKPHSRVPGIRSIQSSVNVDALTAMVFCHPHSRFAGHLADSLDLCDGDPSFMVSAPLRRFDGRTDATHIDLVFNNCFVLVRLAEGTLHSVERQYVEQYELLRDSFDISALPVSSGRYHNFAALRGILASIQYNKEHVFLCDRRRVDFVEAYKSTVACLKSKLQRQRCRVVYWQDLIYSCSDQLANYLTARYSF